MKLATFVVTEVIYQNVKKKVTKITPHRRSGQRQERCTKTPTFFLILLFHIQNFNQLLLKFSSYSKTHKW
jgi:hypothetical protein